MQRLFDLVERQAEERPAGILMAAKIKGIWTTFTNRDIWNRAGKLASGLLSLDIRFDEIDVEKTEKIALISENRPEWLITDLAVQQTGAILTPLYPTISMDEFTYVMNEAAVRIAIFSTQALYDRFKPAFANIPSLNSIFSFDPIEGLPQLSTLQATPEGDRLLSLHRNRIKENTIATIIYTSGTTGLPKGVMLSHRNIVSNIINCRTVFTFAKAGERALSFLPLNHIFEKTVTYVYIDHGISIYYAESMDTIGDNLREVQPIVFTCVPRLLEKVYDRIVSKGAALKGVKRGLFFWALKLARRYDNRDPGSWWYRKQLALANKLVFSKWRAALGGKVIAIVSGAAPLQEKLLHIFCAARITIMEGYGLTETAPVVSVNFLESENRSIGTVGPVLPNVEVKIAEDGEILCRGDNVMIGYYKQPELTAATIDQEGWLHTGDIGAFSDGRFLSITDRKKEMFKTSGGKYVAPQSVENRMRESRFIEQIAIVGPGRKFVAALIVPSFVHLREQLDAQGIAVEDHPARLIAMPEAIALIQAEVDRKNQLLNRVEQVKKFTLLPEEWTTENGLLTPKLSLRRDVIENRFAWEIEKMYR